ncbi:MAG: hypothetical protein CL526_07315 [Aequorivita sp.]|nr:hypothetical protein [Aequorivita sp.]|tara:strand:- start:43268 stop:43972 length:705 start_codon:yes stop_codon:yes gene_type:complete
MELKELLLLQFIAHLCLDYFFQSNQSALHKNNFGFRSAHLYWHGLICFLLSWVFSLQLNFVFAAAFIAISHLLIDGFKNQFVKIQQLKRYIFFIDQAIHLAIITVVVFLFSQWKELNPTIIITLNFKYLLIIAGYLLCLKPANIFIREVFKATEIQVSSDNEMPNAGKVIGVLERILTLTLIIVSQYSAVGFLIAAKSILRYGNNETLKTEYVLIGTLLSFGIAVIVGIVINLF